jgi:hypothetical protein
MTKFVQLALIVLFALLGFLSAQDSVKVEEAPGMQAGFLDFNSTMVKDATIYDETGSQHGFDISSTLSSSSASCLKNNGYSFAVPRGYKSTGLVPAPHPDHKHILILKMIV